MKSASRNLEPAQLLSDYITACSKIAAGRLHHWVYRNDSQLVNKADHVFLKLLGNSNL